MLKRILAGAVVIAIALAWIAEGTVLAANQLPEGVVPFRGELNAQSAVLMDIGSGTVLFEKNAHKRLPIASVTKIMTMLLIMEALESGQITYGDTVSASYETYRAGTQGTSIFLEPGETASVEELLLAVAVASANDAAVALAEHIAGTTEAFVEMMNQKARQLGMKNTEFVDPCGLDDSGYSSAYDVALMSRELMTKYYPRIKAYLETYLTYYKDNTPDRAEILNTNRRFMRGYDKATGLKTGWTTKAGFCLSATAKHGDLHLNAVVLGCANDRERYQDVVDLCNYGFSQFDSLVMAQRGVAEGEVVVDKGTKTVVTVTPDRDLSLLIKRGESPEQYRKTVTLAKRVSAPVNAGQKVGSITIAKGDKVVASVDLVTLEHIDRAGLLHLFKRVLKAWVR